MVHRVPGGGPPRDNRGQRARHDLHLPMKLLLLLSAAALLAACSGPQVRMLGTGDGPPAYELVGDSAAALRAQAERLCEQGYVVLRAAQNITAPQSDGDAGGRWLLAAGDWLSGMPGDRAQATVQCRG